MLLGKKKWNIKSDLLFVNIYINHRNIFIILHSKHCGNIIILHIFFYGLTIKDAFQK